jgi:EAL domain-containing protein (putative c-di-GMP-specific phosphodiesterase class I)
MFSGGEKPLLAIALCALALLAGQALLAAYTGLQAELAEKNNRQVIKRISSVSSSQDAVQKQADYVMSEMNTMKAKDQARSEAMTQSLNELKTSYQALALSITGQTSVSQNDDVTFAAAPAPDLNQDSQSLMDQLFLSLEPIVDLVSGKTAHYRVHLGSADLVEEVARRGLRPDLDLMMVTEALNLLARLHHRDSQVKLFATLAEDTLASPQDMLRLLETLHERPDQSESLVFEIPHVTLAGLSSSALDGLGTVARAGQPLALSNVSMAGLDPSALQGLNVRHISIDAAAIDTRFGVPPSYIHFSQMARIANVQVMLANVTDASSLSQLRQMARLGSGAAFAAPRRVRRETPQHAVGLAA